MNEIEMRFLFAKRSKAFGLIFDDDKFEHAEAMAMIIRITRGNFRLIERLFAQMKRIMAVNKVEEVSGVSLKQPEIASSLVTRSDK